jgi:hypothetical protein
VGFGEHAIVLQEFIAEFEGLDSLEIGVSLLIRGDCGFPGHTSVDEERDVSCFPTSLAEKLAT